MKNRFLIVLLTTVISLVNANNNDTAEQLTTTFAETGAVLYLAHQEQEKSLQSEVNYRKKLYWLFENNPHFYKMDRFQKNLDYYIAILTDHIKVLEGKIALKRTGFHTANMGQGILAQTLSIVSGYASYSCFNHSKALSNDLLRQESMYAAVGWGVASAMLAVVAGNRFYKVSRYQERLGKRLERDKKVLAVLQQVKADQESKQNSAIKEKVGSVIQSLVTAVKGLVQG